MNCGHGVGEAAKGAYRTVVQTADDLYEDILPTVNATINTLERFNSAMTHITAMIINATNLLRECDVDGNIDTEDKMVKGLEGAEESLRGGVEILRAKRRAAEAAAELDGENEFRVINAYDHAIVTLGGLHDAAVDFRWVIMEHDSDNEQPEGEAMSSPEEVIRSALN